MNLKKTALYSTAFLRKFYKIILLISCIFMASTSFAQTGESAAEKLARLLQNPLANISAIMTDNDISFNTGTQKKTTYSFQIQPVYAFDFPEKGFTFIPRAVVPVIGAIPESDLSKLGEIENSSKNRIWGMSDIVTQFFFAPHTKSKWKFGMGPQLSWKTRTDDAIGGPDWGAGIAGVVTGDITQQLSFAGIVGNLWSYNGSYNLLSMQPQMFYNVQAIKGAYIGYNGNITANWKASPKNRWTVPLGLVIGKSFDLGGGGYGLDINAGPYWNVVKPDGAANWFIKFGVNLIFPK